MLDDNHIKRFWSLVATDHPNKEMVGVKANCWPWMGRRNPKGYGVFTIGNAKKMYAHRVVWTLTHGPIPTNKQILHACDCPPCVNPNHLSVGTNADNVRDWQTRGNHGLKGIKNGGCKLTDTQVLSMRSEYPAISCRKLAQKYGISKSAVYEVVSRQRWTHI